LKKNGGKITDKKENDKEKNKNKRGLTIEEDQQTTKDRLVSPTFLIRVEIVTVQLP